MDSDRAEDKKQPSLIHALPLKIALIYGVISAVIFLASEIALSVFSVDKSVFARLELLKDWIFVALTSVILFFLIRRHLTAIERSDRALRESEAKFHMLAETTTSAIFIYRDRILVVNTAMEKLTGYSREELLAMDYLSLVHPEFRAEMRQHCEALARGAAEPLRCEHKLVTRTGAERWVDFTSNVILYDGEKAGLGTAFDITDLRNAMNALQESEERFRLLIDRVTDYEIFMLDTKGLILTWNVAAERNKGYAPGEIIGRHHALFFTGEDIARGIPEQELERAAEKGRHEDEGWRVRKDGTLFWANVVTTALYDDAGRLEGFVKVVRDITERKKAEESLRESEERYRIVAESASDAIVTITEDSTIIFASAAVEKVFGYTPSEIIGQPITTLMPDRLRRAHLAGMQQLRETGRKSVPWEGKDFTGLHKEGYEVPLEVSYGDFVKQGRHYFTGVIRDVSERKEAEREKEYKEALERFNKDVETVISERTMGLMALKMADRVRNPAAIIGLVAKKAMGSSETSDSLRSSLGAILEQAENLETTVKEFHDLLKSRESAFTYEDVNEIVRSVMTVIRPEAATKKIQITVSLSSRKLRINAQKDLLRAAVSHVLRNAVDATPEGGTITVSTSGDERSVTLSVSDTGPGIPPGILEKIFDPLFTTKTRRFGMGLPLVKQIVSEHLGEIVMQSEVGRGTTLSMVFPLRWREG